jgi:calcineurin-like phosphoesterase family protein
MKRLVAALTFLALPLAARAEAPEPFSFALIGDTPYSRFERLHLPTLLERIAASGAAFIIHAGDFKDGGVPCDDALFRDRLALFDDQPLPFVLTPGDNEWTDCARKAGGGFDPVERLDWLRRHFYPPGQSLGHLAMAVASQADDPAFAAYRENLHWQRGPVLFLTVNLPGGDNHRGSRQHPRAEYLDRLAANRAWLAEGFGRAREGGLGVVVVVFQANPGFEDYAASRPDNGYRDFIDQLLAETRTFPGEVVAVHGDSHAHRIDHPLRDPATGEPLPNFTRVETYGYPFMGWVRARVEPEGRPLLRFESHPYAPAP